MIETLDGTLSKLDIQKKEFSCQHYIDKGEPDQVKKRDLDVASFFLITTTRCAKAGAFL